VSRVALQLWTIRDEVERDLEDSLRTVGALGYDGVELIEVGHDAAQVRAWLDECGLVAAGRHTSLEAIEAGVDALADELRTLDTDRLVVAWIDPESLADPDPLVERIAAAARSAAGAGMRVGFHNHWSEVAPLADGRTFLDRLRELPADRLWFELDLGWVWHAGGDPIAELAATRGRCPLVHLKDYASREGRDDVPVGDGLVGYERLIPAALEAGAEWLVVEEDDVGPDPFGAIGRSLEAVRRMVG
jgi:sugar phosphate isomerase/epimerase